MNESINVTNQSNIWEVDTSVGKFTIHFPCGVFTEEHIFNCIPKAVRDFEFLSVPEGSSEDEKSRIADLNASALQDALNKAIRCGTDTPQGRVSINWSNRKVYVM